jgi:hypothetical protein
MNWNSKSLNTYQVKEPMGILHSTAFLRHPRIIANLILLNNIFIDEGKANEHK